MRKWHNQFGDHDENAIPEDQKFTLWGDLDISLLATARGKDWFMSMIPITLVEVSKYGEVREQLFDDLSFLINTEKNRHQWIIRLDAENLTMTKVLWYPIVIEKKKAIIISCMNAQDTNRWKTVDEASKFLEINADCQKSIFWKILLPLDTLIGNETFETVTVPINASVTLPCSCCTPTI